MPNPIKLKRVVIKEELVALTGDYVSALILNQFVYWSERVKDADKLIQEETERMSLNGVLPNLKFDHGWFYKKAEELSTELMLNSSDQTIRRKIKSLIDHGWIYERRNPNYSWDKTFQYRVDLIQIMTDLSAKGYHLEGYESLQRTLNITNLQIGFPYLQFGGTENDYGDSLLQNGNSYLQSGNSGPHIGRTDLHNRTPNLHGGQAIPEITTEITTDSKLNERLIGAANASSTNISFNNNEIYEVLKSNLPKYCYIADNIPMHESYIESIFLMLIQHHKDILLPEIVIKACERYFENSCNLDLSTGDVSMKIKINNPIGYFSTCYEEAYKLYKVKRGLLSK
ncbi:hypothetical protein GC101_12955 [Paenibacillus sp. LMG 31459]|uniref:Uncharacterized protein n=1 Tax=Paenibacillus phytohabitans TaxID=2654978 RepID=A0ABX1YFK4_9BACL|nr:hypothetical protein [Paenibacillus phytohabitans]NOU79783.1 hypothetical protein [Paenibacillus phytohabitans]